MAHEEVNFLGNTFVENINEILFKDPSVDIDANGLPTTPIVPVVPLNPPDDELIGAIAPNNIDTFFQSFDTANKRLPTTWDEFIQQINDFYGLVTPISPDLGVVLNSFVDAYRSLLGIGGGANDPVGGDFQPLANQGVQTADIVEQFKTFFGHFLANFTYFTVGPSGRIGPAGQETDTFFQRFYVILTQTGNIDNTSNLTSFREIYLGYGFDDADFETRLKEFYDKKVAEDGFFVPSVAFSDWFVEIRNEFINAASATSVAIDPTPTGAEKVLILDRILRLLIEMIDILHSIAASQSGRLLGLLTQWQRAYTDLLTEVPTFTSSDGSKLGGSGSNFENARNEINQKMASLLEEIRSRRSIVQDDAKAMQSVINQSQDAANQQTNIATAILQQLSTILGAIFR